MKSYTDLEQSKKLAEILPLESADMIWYGTYCGMDGLYHLLNDEYNEFGLIAINKEFCKTLFRPGDEHVDWLPCWSLANLLGVIPNYKLSSEHNYHTCTAGTPFGKETIAWFNNPVDACYEMIIKLKEQNFI